MNYDKIFSFASNTAMIGWLILMFMPFWKSREKFLAGIVVAGLSVTYAWLIISRFSFGDMASFGTLDRVAELFTSKQMLLAGWIHYLAFDLFVGIFIHNNAHKHRINHWHLLPVYLCTFMLGPIGLLLYFIIRWFITHKYFAANY
jgi:hypothetical protein